MSWIKVLIQSACPRVLRQSSLFFCGQGSLGNCLFEQRLNRDFRFRRFAQRKQALCQLCGLTGHFAGGQPCFAEFIRDGHFKLDTQFIQQLQQPGRIFGLLLCGTRKTRL